MTTPDIRFETGIGKSVIESAPVIVLLLDQDGIIDYANPFFEQITGRSLEGFRGKPWFEIFLPARDQSGIRELFETCTAGTTVQGKVNAILTASGEERMINWHAQVMREDGKGVICIGIDATAQFETEADLRHSNSIMRDSQRLAQLGSWDLDLRTGTLNWSDETYRIFQRDPESFPASYDAFLSVVHPDDRDGVDRAYKQSLIDRQPYNIEHRLLLPDGSIAFVREQGDSLFDSQGKALQSMGTVLDITELKLAEQKLRASLRVKDMLLREVNHRVKNNLQIISSLLHFQSKADGKTVQPAIFEEARKRLLAMELVHDKLYQADELSQINFGEYTKSLVVSIRESMTGAHQIEIETDIDNLSLPIETAQTCGMILCELITNVFKHAYPNQRSGKVSIKALQENGRVRLCVSDEGIGFPEGFNPAALSSLGWQLIQNLVNQLDGTIETTTEKGVHACISIPIEPSYSDPGASFGETTNG